MIRAVAIDDEPLALKVLESLCSEREDIALEKTFVSPGQLLSYLEVNRPGLIFCDIQMPALLGTELVNYFDSGIAVVFTTAFSEYALEGFNLNAVDYLLKPITRQRFAQCIVKVGEHLSKVGKEEKSIFLRADYSTIKLQPSEIEFVEGYDDYIKIYRKDSAALVVRMTLKSIGELLPASDFIRVHKSYIIAKKSVVKFNNQRIFIDGKDIPIGNKYREINAAFFESLRTSHEN